MQKTLLGKMLWVRPDTRMDRTFIAIVTNHDDDVYCFRRELVEELAHKGYDVLVSCPYGEKLDLITNIRFVHRDTAIDRRGMNPAKDIRLMWHYYRLLREYRPAAVLTYTVKPNIYASMAARLLHIPYINNVTGLGSVFAQRRMPQLFIIGLMRIAFRRSRMVFFQNEENMRFAVGRKMVYGAYHLIPGSGVNTVRFPLADYPPDDTIVFNYIGRVLYEKGIDDYLEAARQIKTEYPNTEFNIIGFIEPTETKYKDLFDSCMDTVVYRGYHKDVRPFIARAHATIHPSKYGEGISNVLLESASCGRPLITTDSAGCRETVENGVTGFLYPRGDVPALVVCIRKFLALDHAKRKEMGMLGREWVQHRFSRDTVVNAYMAALEDCISAGAKAVSMH